MNEKAKSGKLTFIDLLKNAGHHDILKNILGTDGIVR